MIVINIIIVKNIIDVEHVSNTDIVIVMIFIIIVFAATIVIIVMIIKIVINVLDKLDYVINQIYLKYLILKIKNQYILIFLSSFSLLINSISSFKE